MAFIRTAACICACLPVFAVRAGDAPAASPAPSVAPPAASPAVPAAAPASATPRRPAGVLTDRLHLKDGRELTGELVAWSPTAGISWRRRAFPRPVTFPAADLFRLTLSPPPADAALPQVVVFADGSALPGKVLEFSADKIVVETACGGKVTAKAQAVCRFGQEEPALDPEAQLQQAIQEMQRAKTPAEEASARKRMDEAMVRRRRMEEGNMPRQAWLAAPRASKRPSKPPPAPAPLAPGMRRIGLANGDTIDCREFTVHEGKAKVTTEAGPLEIPCERIRSCEWAAAPAAAPARAADVHIVRLAGPPAGTLYLRLESIADGKLTGSSDLLGKIELSLDAVSEIE